MAAATSDAAIGAVIKELSGLIEADATTAFRKTVMDAFRGVVLKTPVDTGRARASWRVGQGSPDLSVAPPGQGATPGTLTSAAESLVNSIQAPQLMFVTNNLPYITALENGHSKQAPAGMVRVTIAELNLSTISLLGSL